jgi:hypothetical protein
MKRQIGIIMAVWLITSAFLRADTSYLLIQGPFGSGSSELSYKWQINYPSGDLITGQDLLDSIFGNPVDDGDVNDPVFGMDKLAVSGNSTMGASYVDFGNGDYLLLSVTINSVTISTNDSTPIGTSTVGWNYFVAGGSGDYAVYDSSNGLYSYGAYPNTGSWNFSNDGTNTRFLSDGSYDGWLYGNTGSDAGGDTAGSPATVDDSTNSDDPSDFSNTGANDVFMVMDIPEPRVSALLGVALAGLVFWKGKARA